MATITREVVKVWVYRSGAEIVATPVTKGRRPKPKLFSERRSYGRARSKVGALEALAQTLGISVEDMEVEALTFEVVPEAA